MDPSNHRKGYSKIRAILKEIFSDDEASAWISALLRNQGVPGVVISPAKTEVRVGTLAAQAIKNDFKNKTTGDARGEPIILTVPVDIEQFGFNPEQMNLSGVTNKAEERITAVFGAVARAANAFSPRSPSTRRRPPVITRGRRIWTRTS